MKVVAIHQPQYLPWLPLCDKIDSADVFVYLDTVQYHRRGVQNRNQIKTSSGPLWLTVPVSAAFDAKIRDVVIASKTWSRKHVLSVEHGYAGAPFLSAFDEGLKPIVEGDWQRLADLNIAVTEWILDRLGTDNRRLRASELDVSGSRDDLLISICEAVGADTYLSGAGGRNYQDEEKFRRKGIALRYQAYQAVPYPQRHPQLGFVPDLSALDLILNLGPEARSAMLAGRGSPSR